ncbi:MAG: protein kinase [Deltaproteobacteria bacterium]|nr:protein kinase [Deltaproteobacteria bacterium]
MSGTPEAVSTTPSPERDLGEAPGDEPPPVIANRYRIVRFLGAGGFGSVYEAVDERLEKPVAVKLLGARRARAEGAIDRFRAEAMAASRLSHPYIVGVTDFDVLQDGRPYLVMEYAAGETLEQLLEHEHRLPIAVAARVANAVCLALSAAHEHQVVHRDLKPANIIVQISSIGSSTKNSEHKKETTSSSSNSGLISDIQTSPLIKILDFGVAKIAEGRETPTLTRTGHILGTPAYMAPEQIRSKLGPVDARSDVYALGMVLYEMLTGTTPFAGLHVADMLVAHLMEAPAPPSQHRPEIPQAFDSIVLKAIEKRPEKRFQSAAELAHVLSEYMHYSPDTARRSAKRRWRGLAIAAVCVLAAVPAGPRLRSRPSVPAAVVDARASLPPAHEVPTGTKAPSIAAAAAVPTPSIPTVTSPASNPSLVTTSPPGETPTPASDRATAAGRRRQRASSTGQGLPDAPKSTLRAPR